MASRASKRPGTQPAGPSVIKPAGLLSQPATRPPAASPPGAKPLELPCPHADASTSRTLDMDELAFSFLLALVSVVVAATVALITRHRERANVSAALAGVESARKVKAWPRYALKEAILVSHNTKLFRFSLPSPNDSLGLPPGRHVMLRATVNGERVVRPYTPTSHPRQPGHFDLVIKVRTARDPIRSASRAGAPHARGSGREAAVTSPVFRRQLTQRARPRGRHTHSERCRSTSTACLRATLWR